MGNAAGLFLFIAFIAAAFIYVDMTKKPTEKPADEKK